MKVKKRTLANSCRCNIGYIHHLYVDKKRYNLDIYNNAQRADCTFDCNNSRCFSPEGCNNHGCNSACKTVNKESKR